MKKIFNYVGLLVKYEVLKREDLKHIKKIEKYEIENKTLRVCLENEGKRVIKFRSCYKDVLNEYENLANEYEKEQKEKNSLLRKIKKLEKEFKNGNEIKKGANS